MSINFDMLLVYWNPAWNLGIIITYVFAAIGLIFVIGYPHIAKLFSSSGWTAPAKRVNGLWLHGFAVMIMNNIIFGILNGCDAIFDFLSAIPLPVRIFCLSIIVTILSIVLYSLLLSVNQHESWGLALRKVGLGLGLVLILEIPLAISGQIIAVLFGVAEIPVVYYAGPMVLTDLVLPFILFFWINKNGLDSFFHKISGGTFEVPKSRFNMLLINGFGCLILTALACAGIVSFYNPEYPDGRLMYATWTFAGVAGYFVAVLYWLIAWKVSRSGSPALVVCRLLYGLLEAASWVLVVVAAAIAVVAVLVLAAVVFFVWLILTFATAKEFTVKPKGLFGQSKKVWGTENLDGTVDGLDGKKYKKVD